MVEPAKRFVEIAFYKAVDSMLQLLLVFASRRLF